MLVRVLVLGVLVLLSTVAVVVVRLRGALSRRGSDDGDRLATLVGLEMWCEEACWAAVDRDTALGEDEALYQCRACGRVYVGPIEAV